MSVRILRELSHSVVETVVGMPEVRAKIIKGVHEEVQNRSLLELEAHRDEILLGLRKNEV